MTTTDTIKKETLKVYVKMSDGQRMLGHFFTASDERLQDIMNDSRDFLPLHALRESGKPQLIMLSKRYIQQVEEVHDQQLGDSAPQASDTQVKGREERVKSSPRSALKLELD